ncbi:MAG TPA: hypothetical protein VFY65_08945 [Longimicrobium sp.]|nr:hypothetical protein [Longimicrobium sp.]
MSRPPAHGTQITINNNTMAPGAAAFATPAGHLTCPRCGFQGEGVSYFSQGGPIMGALFLALLTLPFMGAGGLVYYLMRHDYRACPRCGNSWGKRSEHARALSAGLALNEVQPAMPAHEPEMREDARLLRWASYLIFAFAAILIMAGLGDGAPEAVIFGALAAGGGTLLWKKANSAREERREKLLMQLQQPVLRLASQRNGVLTVTDVAAALSWPMPRAEKVLNSLEDGLRVASSVTDEGVIVYEFRELMHAPRMNAAEMDTLLNPGAGPNQAQRAAMPLPHNGTLSA